MRHPRSAVLVRVAVVVILGATGCTGVGGTRPGPGEAGTGSVVGARGGGGEAGTTTSAVSPPTVLRVDQVIVDGTLSAAHLDDAVAGPLAMPVLVTIPERGRGRLEIDGVSANGHASSTIAWDGGQPLPLSGTGTLDLTPATIDADPGGLTWHLDGVPRALSAGQYAAGSPVAVGSRGLASPQDRAAFSVATGSVGQIVTAGDARIHEAPRHLELTGPGSVTLTGMITVHGRAGIRTARQIRFGPGPFHLTLDPSAGGYHLAGLLQGPTSVTPN